ncbi:Major facilitator superfamily domain, general substrate transporter [Penicillium expansum]|uniref:Major facilitator superfamily domain, general substrate transporter n=1 Tax=Penicillium expansum TaxID=27334 RepID=A0A0A2JW43_PENEN|nr:Major facilitator superfamily domain, general substrate transporter [Penicillium expansum]KGO58878.1 Major facilitator superfamily domain, general substrate transporter [Penicillium expansum]
MGYTTLWKRLSPRQLNVAIQIFSLISIFFEGYDQGVMGGVNSAPKYVTEVGIGKPDGTVTDTTHQGGIVSIYYLGAIFGCFAGGWLADRVGRINGLLAGSTFALIGGALQAAAQDSNFMLCARVITGIGTGALTGITPVLVSETASANHRGGFLGYVFIAKISVAYWISFGLAFVDNGYSDVRWRFLLAFQCFPALILVAFIKMLPDSPRYLASVGRSDEARDLLNRIRKDRASQDDIEREYLEIIVTAEGSKRSSPIEFGKILFGKGGKPGMNLGRRAWLCVWLQIMASWTGITAVTAYSPTLLAQAGYSDIKQNGLAGGINTIGIIGTIISAQIIDRFGRRVCLMGGAAVLFAVNLIAGAVYEGSLHNPENASQYAPGAVTMLFLFNLGYAATWGTVAFLIPTEIFPSDLRAQGNGFGITGWAIGVGMTTLVNPIMFNVMTSRTYFLFAGLNLLWIPIVYLFYPETRNRSLESIDALFSTTSPFYWKMEQAYKLHGDVLAEHGVSRGEVLSDGKTELTTSPSKVGTV